MIYLYVLTALFPENEKMTDKVNSVKRSKA